MPEPIIFYDIPSTNPGKAWSPNPWKTRFSLNYKGIPYKTVWVEYPDIEPLCKKIGAAPTAKKPDGSDLYTLPVIQDPSTGKVISESFAIAKYLDATYPATPQLLPPGTVALQEAFVNLSIPTLIFPALFVTFARFVNALNPPSRAYSRATREPVFGRLEDKNDAKAWGDLEKGLEQIKSFLDSNGEGKNMNFLGEKDKFTFSDFFLASLLISFRIVTGEGSEDWRKVAGWGDGFAAKFLAQVEKYAATDA